MQRLLKRQLPEDVRKQKEAELASLQQEEEHDAAKRKRTEREKCFSKKYRKIKFFERRKVERQVTLLERQLEKSSDGDSSRAEIEEKLQHEKQSLLYIRHFPRHKKYLSLFPKENSEDPFVTRQRAKIRRAIVKRAAAGLLNDAGDDEDESGSEAMGGALEDDDFFAAGEDDDDDDA